MDINGEIKLKLFGLLRNNELLHRLKTNSITDSNVPMYHTVSVQQCYTTVKEMEGILGYNTARIEEK